jgi:Flp pilus assembly protein TadG
VGEGNGGLTALRDDSSRVSASHGGDPVARFGRLRGEDGQHIVEFAMVLPILAALVLIFIQFGKAINYWIDLTHVANEGARLATVGAPGVTNFKSAVCDTLETGELRNGSNEVDAATVTVSYPNTTRDVGDPVRVAVAATYHWLPFWNVGTWNIQGSATMRLERDETANGALAPASGSCP